MRHITRVLSAGRYTVIRASYKRRGNSVYTSLATSKCVLSSYFIFIIYRQYLLALSVPRGNSIGLPMSRVTGTFQIFPPIIYRRRTAPWIRTKHNRVSVPEMFLRPTLPAWREANTPVVQWVFRMVFTKDFLVDWHRFKRYSVTVAQCVVFNTTSGFQTVYFVWLAFSSLVVTPV